MSDSLFSLDGRVVLVTGAGRGLGFAIAHAVAMAGAHVVVNGRDAGRATAAAERISAEGGKASTAIFDIADDGAAARAIAAIGQRHGRLDGLVNNVGARNRKPLFDFTLEEVRRLLDIDLVAGFKEAAAAISGDLGRSP